MLQFEITTSEVAKDSYVFSQSPTSPLLMKLTTFGLLLFTYYYVLVFCSTTQSCLSIFTYKLK